MKKIHRSNKSLKRVILETSEIAGYLWQRGWAERNASNISVNVSDYLQPEFSEHESFPLYKLTQSYPILSGKCFLITGTGKRMRDLARKPMKNALLIRLNNDASGYYIISQKNNKEIFLPTSELSTHMGVHQMIAERGSAERVVMHTHAHELVTLTHSADYCNQEALNKLLWSMHPETMIFIPEGVGFVPYLLPGSDQLATETLKILQNHNVALWEKHGVVAIGKSVADTFDVIDILAKSARIFFLCRSANIEPAFLTDEQLADLKKLSAKF